MWVATWRLRRYEHESLQSALQNQEPLIFAHWHRDELSIVNLVGRYKIATMTSTSKDGQLIDFVIRARGGATSKGSSTRGAVGALKGLVRLVRQGYRASMAVDGPKGPIYQVKPGVFELAKLCRARIVPVGAAANRRFVFEKSWNKARLPYPFAKVRVVFGESFAIGPNDDLKSAALAEQLKRKIDQACAEAQANL